MQAGSRNQTIFLSRNTNASHSPRAWNYRSSLAEHRPSQHSSCMSSLCSFAHRWPNRRSPQLLHWLLRLLRSQMPVPPHSLQMYFASRAVARRPCCADQRQLRPAIRRWQISTAVKVTVLNTKSTAFYISLKSKVGLIAAKAAALRVNMNTESCLIASHPSSRHLASSHASSLFYSSLTNTLPRPRN